MKKLIPLLACFLLLLTNAWGADVKVSWNANSESDVAGYKLYYGTAAGTYSATKDVGNVISTIVTLSPSVGQKYYFAVTCYDTSGNESAKSTEASCLVPDSTAPAPPSGLTALIQKVIAFLKTIFKVV